MSLYVFTVRVYLSFSARFSILILAVKIISTVSPASSINTFSLKNPGIDSDSRVVKSAGTYPNGLVSFTSAVLNLLRFFSFLSSITTCSLEAGA